MSLIAPLKSLDTEFVGTTPAKLRAEFTDAKKFALFNTRALHEAAAFATHTDSSFVFNMVETDLLCFPLWKDDKGNLLKNVKNLDKLTYLKIVGKEYGESYGCCSNPVSDILQFLKERPDREWVDDFMAVRARIRKDFKDPSDYSAFLRSNGAAISSDDMACLLDSIYDLDGDTDEEWRGVYSDSESDSDSGSECESDASSKRPLEEDSDSETQGSPKKAKIQV